MKEIIKKMVVKLNIVNFLSIFLYIFRIYPIKNNRILFENFTGKGYGDSPKYIAEKLMESDNNYELYWVIKNDFKFKFPKNIKTIKLYSLKYFYIMATAKIWVNNSRFDQYVVKRKKQIYIQTWHGGLALKKIEYDAEQKLSDYYKKVMKKDNKNIDYLISNSNFCTEMYKNGFKYDGIIKEYGTPRNDCLINDKERLSQKAKKYYNINDNTKILLYAPTFRNNYKDNPYDIDFANLKRELELTTKNKWLIIVKLHPRINNSNLLIKDSENILDATKYADIQELICACNILLTDYSSTMFEAMIAKKPVIIYAKDIENYNEERGCYFTFDELPFPLAKNNNELIEIIKNNNYLKVENNYNKFAKKVGLKENGDASEKVCNLINKCINGENDE